MANTVVSIFPNPDLARQAHDHLLANGFSDKQVDIKIASYKAGVEDTAAQHTDLIEKVTIFFKDLFGADDKEINQYAHAGSKGSILTVHTATSEDAEKVAQILDTFGAMDVGETSGSYFPEMEDSKSGHKFLDDPAHRPVDNPVGGIDVENTTRAARLRSRIVARSVEKTNGPFDK